MKEEEKKKTKNAKYYKRQLRLSLKLATYSLFTSLISMVFICIGLDIQMELTTKMATSTFLVATIMGILDIATAIYEYTKMKELEKKEKTKKNDSKNN